MENLFNKLSIEENGECHITYKQSYSPFVMSPFSKIKNGLQIKSLTLNVPYKGQTIQVIYSLSNIQTGIVSCTLEKGLDLPEFHIVARSHYWRLFNKKKNILKVECSAQNFSKILIAKLATLQIEETARNFQFEPTILGKKANNQYELKTSYHLAFPNKKEILRPIIDFYKCLIDNADNRTLKERAPVRAKGR